VVLGEKPELYNQPLQTSPHSYEIGQLVLIQCEESTASERCRRYSSCWAIVQHVYESAAVVAVGGDMVRYLFSDLQLIENASPVLPEVCERVMCLWQVKNKPPLLQHLLETFYQRRLEFEQVDLLVLEAIENYFSQT
jgi:hypothetical protein